MTDNDNSFDACSLFWKPRGNISIRSIDYLDSFMEVHIWVVTFW
eukprot:CAMPEP_0170446218 /NCGR_PEP_ID=MMETSP0117_2-20130122/49487_1 /TAXON_ID=400756 /ORGANISM="Durinskia baltica, Strain CSIRO CS-38" /LENGTH=43 /DNA_ID= /DNA_START= /DNA_END= /DNA_ORIENTATION=